MTERSLSIAVLPGDGIGVEVMAAALDVLAAVGRRIGRRFECATHPAGAQHYAHTGESLPDDTNASISMVEIEAAIDYVQAVGGISRAQQLLAIIQQIQQMN